MRFQVPQFIEVEDKIFGSYFTLKQFIYLAGGAGISFVVYILLGNLIFASIPIIIIMGFSAALAFYRINNRPFINIVESAIKFYLGGKLYIWRKTEKPRPKDANTAARDVKSYASVMVPKISDSKLKDLSWSLDIKESLYSNNRQK